MYRNPAGYHSFVLLAILLVILPLRSKSQDREIIEQIDRYDLDYRTVRFSLIPGLSTNGTEASRYASRYSWNILGEYNGALVKGFELGGIANINKYFAHGVQIAGLGNFSGKETTGIQLGGLLNYSGAELQGIQFAGAGNISRDVMQGIQFAGAFNWSDRESQGIQVSGAANLSGGDMQGLMVAGAVNYSGRNMQGIMVSGAANITMQDMQGLIFSGGVNYAEFFQGISAATLNITREFQGIQIGSINITKYGQGIQAGLINYGKDFEGAPVGLISYYEEGRKNFDLWTSDAGFVNAGVKLGTREIYNMLSMGYNPAIGRDVWQVGWSIGRLHEYKTHILYTDFSWFKVNEKNWTKNLNSLLKYRLLFGKEFTNGLQIYGGPTFNLLISREPFSDSYTWYRLFDFGAKGRSYIFWIGYSVGIELF